MDILRKIFLLTVLLSPIALSTGQQTSLYPVSTWINNPMVFNPAIGGSKDFFSIDLVAGSGEDQVSQLLTGNARFVKKVHAYPSSPVYKEYSGFGAGGYFFNKVSGQSHTMGLAVTGSYHIELDKSALSYLTFGVSIKGIYNFINSETPVDQGSSPHASESFNPEFDAGIYYHGQSLYLGLSSTNISWNPAESNSPYLYTPEPRHYFLMGGYKFVISRSIDLVIEPSLIISAYDSTMGDLANNINPILRIYFENFCLGTWFYDNKELSFFFRYNYPRFHLGAFLSIPRGTPYIKKVPTIEISAGINLSYRGSKPYKKYHW